MLHDNTVSLRDQNLNSNLIPSIKNPSIGSSWAIPLVAVTWCCFNTNHSALAIDLNSQISKDNITFTNFSLWQTSDPWNELGVSPNMIPQSTKSSKLLPRIVSWITEPWNNPISNNLARIFTPKEKSQTSLSFQGIGGNTYQDFNPVYLSQAESSERKEFVNDFKLTAINTFESRSLAANIATEIYQVQSGDTINHIAQKFRVSRKELIALNKIKNSNIIFVNQKLKIPRSQTNNSNQINLASTLSKLPSNSVVPFPTASTNSTYLADARLKSRDLAKVEIDPPPVISNNERIAKLRAEIDQMRSQYQTPSKQQGDRQNRDNVLSNSELPLLSSSSTSNYQQNTERPNPDLLSQEAMALNLPPLPAAEEYLPDAFDGYAWPAQGMLTSGYGWRWGRLHKGIDIAAPVGTPVFAAAAGEVISAGWNSGGYGNLIELHHLDGSVTLYAHNNRILVTDGQKVSKGEQIAEMGSTGFSTGSHLHFEIHTQNQGVVNPLALLSPE